MGRNTKKVGMTRGLGTRYGATLRKRYLKVVTEAKRTHKCPHCEVEAVTRVSVGVWHCKKCDATFAGGAYTPVTKLGVVAKRQVKSLSSSSES
jgi:large subunit ribosomal protein L37Ae